jgi:hypothetical protein
MRRFVLLVLVSLSIGLCSCWDDDPRDLRAAGECGFIGNCCWDDKTCNEGVVCNTETMICEAAPEAGLPDGGGEGDAAPEDAAADTGTDTSASTDGSTDTGVDTSVDVGVDTGVGAGAAG